MGFQHATQRSLWLPRMKRYYAWRDQLRWLCKAEKFSLTDQFNVTFILPMPKSWSNKKRADLEGMPHQQKPDTTNLVKAVEDALRVDDERIWNVAAAKLWGREGKIIITTYE